MAIFVLHHSTVHFDDICTTGCCWKDKGRWSGREVLVGHSVGNKASTLPRPTSKKSVWTFEICS
jgi:hypothetical protein